MVELAFILKPDVPTILVPLALSHLPGPGQQLPVRVDHLPEEAIQCHKHQIDHQTNNTSSKIPLKHVLRVNEGKNKDEMVDTYSSSSMAMVMTDVEDELNQQVGIEERVQDDNQPFPHQPEHEQVTLTLVNNTSGLGGKF